MVEYYRIIEKKMARRRAYLVYKMKSWILQWVKAEIFLINFLARKINPHRCIQTYQKKRNGNILGGMFLDFFFGFGQQFGRYSGFEMFKITVEPNGPAMIVT